MGHYDEAYEDMADESRKSAKAPGMFEYEGKIVKVLLDTSLTSSEKESILTVLKAKHKGLL